MSGMFGGGGAGVERASALRVAIRGYAALIRANLKLALREKTVIFFNYVFPLLFFFGFAQMLGGAGGGMSRVVAMVLVIGILGNGLFGAGVRAVVERETNILRRYKVTPISPAPILAASIVVGWILYVPAALSVILLAHWFYGMEIPAGWPALALLISVGCMAFRALGLIVAAVANSTAESNILVQLLYMPMLFISGATIPLSALPVYAQVAAQFLPASYLTTGIQEIMLHNRGLSAVWIPLLALVLSGAAATWISMKVFRWEKDEKIPNSGKLWLLAVFLPFLALGVWDAYSRDHINQAKRLDRQMRRNEVHVIRGARIFLGDGGVIESGAVLVRKGRIGQAGEGARAGRPPDDAMIIEGAGKTLLPGLVDTHIHLSMLGGVRGNGQGEEHGKILGRHLAAYLYSGITAVRSAGDPAAGLLKLREGIQASGALGAELFLCGPMFTAPEGQGTELFRNLPEHLRGVGQEQFLRLPRDAAEAAAQVRALRQQGVDGIKVILDSGSGTRTFPRMENAVLEAIAREARLAGLPLAVHTGGARDLADAIRVGAASIEHGSYRELLEPGLLESAARAGVAYNPMLSVVEAYGALLSGDVELLSRSLVQQVTLPAILRATREHVSSPERNPWLRRPPGYEMDMNIAMENLRRAWRAGMTLAAGSDAGNPLVLHGPTVQRELALWVAAGIPPAVALQAATGNAAALLGAGRRAGFVREGYQANLLLVDGNPMRDIGALERISAVLFEGELVDRAELFEDGIR